MIEDRNRPVGPGHIAAAATTLPHGLPTAVHMLADAARRALAPFVTDDGAVEFPTRAHIVTATKA